MPNYLFGVEGTSFDLSFLHNVIDYIVDDKWNSFSFVRKLFYEVYWRMILRRPFSKACHSINNIRFSEDDVLYLGNIFRREDVLPKLNKLGFKINQNLFEAFDLSPELCEKRREKVTIDEIRKKDYEDDDLKLSIMASLIPKDISSIYDIGCGLRKLKEYIPKSVEYIGIDYIQKGDDIINLDLNKEQLPIIHTDCIFGCGILEFIDDVDGLIKQLLINKPRYVLFSYSPREYSRISTHRSAVYRNCLYSSEVVSYVCSKGYILGNFCRYESRQAIYFFQRV